MSKLKELLVKLKELHGTSKEEELHYIIGNIKQICSKTYNNVCRIFNIQPQWLLVGADFISLKTSDFT